MQVGRGHGRRRQDVGRQHTAGILGPSWGPLAAQLALEGAVVSGSNADVLAQEVYLLLGIRVVRVDVVHEQRQRIHADLVVHLVGRLGVGTAPGHLVLGQARRKLNLRRLGVILRLIAPEERRGAVFVVDGHGVLAEAHQREVRPTLEGLDLLVNALDGTQGPGSGPHQVPLHIPLTEPPDALAQFRRLGKFLRDLGLKILGFGPGSLGALGGDRIGLGAGRVQGLLGILDFLLHLFQVRHVRPDALVSQINLRAQQFLCVLCGLFRAVPQNLPGDPPRFDGQGGPLGRARVDLLEQRPQVLDLERLRGSVECVVRRLEPLAVGGDHLARQPALGQFLVREGPVDRPSVLGLDLFVQGGLDQGLLALA